MNDGEKYRRAKIAKQEWLKVWAQPITPAEKVTPASFVMSLPKYKAVKKKKFFVSK